MILQGLVNKILDVTPRKHWNLLSNILSRFSLPTLKSPIEFKYQGFSLKEYHGDSFTGEAFDKFIAFTYPSDMHNREMEIELDRQYWPSTSTFLVLDQSGSVAGCIQFVQKTETCKLPLEFSHSCSESTQFSIQTENCSEIYRCKRDSSLKGMQALNVVIMLFKAIMAKAIQTETEHSYLTYDPQNRELHNLYTRKLDFADPDVRVLFGESEKQWGFLHKDWAKHETSYASISKTHFFLQTFGRSNLKKRNFCFVKKSRKKSLVETRKSLIKTYSLRLGNI